MPKTPQIMDQPHDSIILERSVEKIIVRRSTISGQNVTDHRLSELYQELKNTAAETRAIAQPNYKVVYNNRNDDIEHLVNARQSFKKYTEESRKKVVADLEAERQKKLEEVQKLENMSNLAKEVLRDLSTVRKQTQTAMQQTFNHCLSLCQQIGLPEERAEDLNVMEQSITSMVQDLKR